MDIILNPKKIILGILSFVAFLVVAHLCVILFKVFTGHDIVYGLIPLFDLGAESNIPTLYSAIAIIFCSTLLWLIAMKHKKDGSSYAYWIGLSFLFIFLAVDETASLHERLMAPLRETLNVSGLLYFAWVIPYSIALIVFVGVYVRFLLRLPRQTMILFITSGAIFVTGAIGFELLGGREAEFASTSSDMFFLFVTFEETLEILGIVLFIHTLLNYMCDEFGTISITINSNNS